MTQSVAQKTLIPEKAWRRQTDSPTWWITFACGSVILHLLALWLVGLYKLNSSQLGRSQSAVAIEFIEVSPQKSYKVQPKPKPKPKAVSPKPATPIVPQKPQPTANLGTQLPPVSTNNNNAIAFDNQKIEQQQSQEFAQQQQRELAELQRQLEAQQRQREAEFQRQLEAQQRQLAQQQRLRLEEQRQLEAQLRQREAEQQRLLAEQIRQQEAEQQRQIQAQRQQEAEQQRQIQAQRQQEAEQQRQIQAQRQREAEQQRQIQAQRQREAEQQRQIQAQRQREAEERQKLLVQRLRQQEQLQQNQNSPDGETITDAIENRVGQTPQQRERNPQAPIKETLLNQSGGILTASWDIDSSAPITRDIPAKLPLPKEDTSKSFVIPASEENNLASANFQVYLMINEEGTVEFARVDENIPVEKRQLYQKYVDKNLLNKKLFVPASDPDPRTGQLKPRRGELFIRIKIQRDY
ncbi:MAG: hypothetical protein AAF915_09080 [Cyanobacteria bacterium P01_D01_bin.50]